MSFATTSDGIRLFYESAGSGTPIIFVHEFGGSHWSWEPQLNFFPRRHRCITFAARGIRPGHSGMSTPFATCRRHHRCAERSRHRQGHGWPVDGAAALHAGLRHLGRLWSCRCGLRRGESARGLFHTFPSKSRKFQERGCDFAPVHAEGARAFSSGQGSARLEAIRRSAGQHHSLGAANTMRGVQMRGLALRPRSRTQRCRRRLVMVGDEDDHCIQPGLYLRHGAALRHCAVSNRATR